MRDGRVSFDPPQHYEHPAFDVNRHNQHEEYDYSPFVHPMQDYPASDYSHLTAELYKYPFDGDHSHEGYKAYDDRAYAGKLKMSPQSPYPNFGVKQHQHELNDDDYYHNHKNRFVSVPVRNERMLPPDYHKDHVIRPYEYDMEYDRPVLPESVRFVPLAEVSRLSQPNVHYLPHPEKHHTHGYPQEMYAHPEFDLDNERHDDYFSHTVERRVTNRPQKAYYSPLVASGRAEPPDSPVLEYKETLPSGSVAAMIFPYYEANIGNLLPKLAPPQGKNDSGPSNSPAKVEGDKNRPAAVPNTYLGQERYFK
jgi:hypothetical protein